jgi:hypothetical protein
MASQRLTQHTRGIVPAIALENMTMYRQPISSARYARHYTLLSGISTDYVHLKRHFSLSPEPFQVPLCCHLAA